MDNAFNGGSIAGGCRRNNFFFANLIRIFYASGSPAAGGNREPPSPGYGESRLTPMIANRDGAGDRTIDDKTISNSRMANLRYSESAFRIPEKKRSGNYLRAK